MGSVNYGPFPLIDLYNLGADNHAATRRANHQHSVNETAGMTERKDDEGKKPDNLPPEPKPENKSSGRVAFDARGNPIWEWQLETGVYSRDVTTQKLKKLDLGELSLVDTGIHKKPTAEPEAATIRKALPGGGFNPYDTSPKQEERSSPYDKARAAAANKQAGTPPPKPAAPPRSPADLRKLDEWVKLKKRIGDAKDDE
jgi:hypothetical protein